MPRRSRCRARAGELLASAARFSRRVAGTRQHVSAALPRIEAAMRRARGRTAPIALLLVGAALPAMTRGRARRRRARRTRARRVGRGVRTSTRPATRRSRSPLAAAVAAREAARGVWAQRCRARPSSCARRPRSARTGALIAAQALPPLLGLPARRRPRDAAAVAARAARGAGLARRRSARRRAAPPPQRPRAPGRRADLRDGRSARDRCSSTDAGSRRGRRGPARRDARERCTSRAQSADADGQRPRL